MGGLHAQEFADMTREGLISLDQALKWHLTSNHFPPVPISMLEPCKKAIFACNEDDYRKEIRLPNGITFKGNNYAPAHEIVDAHHLHAWLE